MHRWNPSAARAWSTPWRVLLRSQTPPQRPQKDVHTRAAEEQLRLALGTDVTIERKRKGGKVAIAFANEDELQRIYEYLTERR